MDSNEKMTILKDLLKKAEKLLADLTKTQKDAQDRANEAEGAMQSRYDTFKEEGQYLSDALKVRCNEAKKTVFMLKQVVDSGISSASHNVQLTAYIEVEFEDNDERGRFLMLPAMAGETVNHNVTVITPASPVGKSLIGKEEGDEFFFIVKGKKRKGEITEVR